MIARFGMVLAGLCTLIGVLVAGLGIVVLLDEWLHPWHKRGKG